MASLLEVLVTMDSLLEALVTMASLKRDEKHSLRALSSVLKTLSAQFSKCVGVSSAAMVATHVQQKHEVAHVISFTRPSSPLFFFFLFPPALY